MPPKPKINISALKRLWELATEPGNSSHEKLPKDTLEMEINRLVSDEIQKEFLLEAAARCEEDGLVDIRKLYVDLLRKPPEEWDRAQPRPQPAMPAVKPPPPPGRPGSAVATAGPASSSLPQEGEPLLSGPSQGKSDKIENLEREIIDALNTVDEEVKFWEIMNILNKLKKILNGPGAGTSEPDRKIVLQHTYSELNKMIEELDIIKENYLAGHKKSMTAIDQWIRGVQPGAPAKKAEIFRVLRQEAISVFMGVFGAGGQGGGYRKRRSKRTSKKRKKSKKKLRRKNKSKRKKRTKRKRSKRSKRR